MKLKLLFFMGILSVLCNTVNAQNLAPEFQAFPPNRIECPGYVAANVQYQVTDSNTAAPFLIVNATFTKTDLLGGPGGPDVTFTYAQDPTGILRSINVIPDTFTSGIVTVTLTVSDVGVPLPNKSATATFTVTFEDVTPPLITSAPLVDLDVDINSGDCDFVVPDYTSLLTATDYCGGVASMQTPSIGTLLSNHNTTQLIVLSATDDYGNVASQSFTITLKDVTPPTVITQDITVSLDGTGNVVITPSQIDNGSTDNCSLTASLTYSLDITSFDCSDTGENTVTLTVTDAVGNWATNTATVTVVDDIAPVITCFAPIAVNNDIGLCGAVVTITDATATDNCSVGLVVDGTRDDSLALSADYSVGTTTITWTATDASGNATSCTQTVTVNDTENPVAAAQNITVELDATGSATISVLDIEDGSTDNCGIVASLSVLDITSFTCANLGANTVVLTVEDAAGNTDTANATVTVVDLLKPEINPSADENVDNDLGQCGAMVTVSATATDNCTNPIVATGVRYFNNVADGLLLTAEYPVGTTTIVWTATDSSGNVATATQTVTVNDVEDPVIVSPMLGGFNALITVDNDDKECFFTTANLLTDLGIVPTGTDNCSVGLLTVTVSPATVNVSPGPDHPTELITWTVTDSNGNTATATQEILVRDLVLPVMRTKDISRNFDANGQVIITVADIDDGSEDNSGDACFDKYVVDNIIDCDEVGVHDVVLFGKDLWGNQHYSIAKVTTSDNTDPTFVEASLPIIDLNTNTGCTWVGVLPIPATADNCSVVSVTNDAPAEFPLGDTTFMWTVEDAAGNAATMTQQVTVTDAQNPIAIAKVGVVVELDTLGDATITALDIDNGSSDNCGIVASLSLVSPNKFTCDNVGANVVTLTVTDASGNVSTIDTVITVVDNTVPTLVTKPFTATLSNTGVVTVVASDVVVSSSDACGIKSTVVSPNIFTCSNLGANPVSVTVTDNNGNVTTETTVVTVEDNQVPTIAVTDIEVDTNSGCIWTGTLGLPVTADNCSVVSVTSNRAADFAYPVGDTDVIWTATDAAGNIATATQVVTVNDSELPIAKTNSFSVTLDAAGEATITPAQVDNGSSDNCGILSTTIDISSFDCDTVGENTVVLTVTDNNNNVSTANATITVVDATAPVLVTKAYTATLSSTGTVSIVASDVITTATDICGIKSSVVSPFEFTCANLGANTVTVTVTDNNNNVTTGIATVTVEDTTKPSITVTNITVDANAGCIWTGTLGLPVTADNCSVVSVTSNRAADFAYPVGDTDVIWTVTDAAGNSNNATHKVTVRDTEKPIAKASDITIKLSSTVGAGSASITVADVNNGSSDNCGIKSVKIGVLKLDELTFNCSNVGPNTVVLTVTDNSDNVSTANAIVTVVDDTLPVIASGAPIAVNTSAGICGANLAVTPSATATDNCTVGSPVGTRSDAKALSATYPLGRTTITWNVKDANGNAALPVIQTVDVTDAQIPVITSNGNKTANADLGGCSAVVTVSATATDNCGVGSPVGVRSDALPLAAAYPVGTTTITWNVTDVNGNAAVAVTQTVIVTDTQRPVITANGNKNFVSDFGQCGAIVAVSATATDNCSVGTPVGIRSDNAALNALYPVGTTTITWNVTDVNLNSATPVVQTVVVRDLQIPVINGTVVSIDANTDANACGASVIVTPPTASDNCSVTASVVGTRSDNLAISALYPIGSTTITWRVSDIYGNVAVPTTTTVKVKDMVLPTVITKNIPIQLNVGGFATIVPAQVNDGSTDNCGIASYSLDKVSFNCLNVGANTVTLTVIDIHGNINTGTAIVTISEPIIPIARTRNITVQLNAAGTVSILPSDINNGSTDNCSIASYTLSNSTFDCSNVGQNIITLTATDASGNNSVPASATVTVQDNVAPVVRTTTYTAQLDVNGLATVTPDNVNNGSTDACGIASYAISKSVFTCDNVGENIITLSATDVNGNVGQAFATVIVEDKVAPEVITRNISLVLDNGSVTIMPEDVLVSATDNCGVDMASYSLSKDTFTIVDVLASPVTIFLTVMDINGNSTVTPVTITFPIDPTEAAQVITPNGDGINDTWVVENITNHQNSVVRVFNRWGSLVYSAKNYQNDWDGKLNGSDSTVPDAGSYYYQIDLDGTGNVDSEGWLFISRQ